MASCVPINLAAKHIEHNGEVHQRDVMFQWLGFTNNETQRRPGVQFMGHDRPIARYSHRVSSLYIPLQGQDTKDGVSNRPSSRAVLNRPSSSQVSHCSALRLLLLIALVIVNTFYRYCDVNTPTHSETL